MKLRGSILALALAILLLPQTAYATTVYQLAFANQNLKDLVPPGTTNFGEIRITLTGPTTASITMAVTSNYWIVGDFAVNVNAASFTNSHFSYAPASQSGLVSEAKSTTKTMDGFGEFNDIFNAPNSGAKDPKTHQNIIIQSVSFDVTNQSGTWTDSDHVLLVNSSKYAMVAAAHLAVFGQKSTGYVGADPPLNPPSPAPAPATLLLLGSGLLALGVKRRFRKH